MTSPGLRFIILTCLLGLGSAQASTHIQAGSGTAQDQPAAVCTWSGTVNTDWSNAGNWTGCGGNQPQSGDSVIVGAAANQPTLSTTAPPTGDLGSITVNSGGKITVGVGGSLNTNAGPTINASGEIEVSGGTVTMSGGNLTVNGTLRITSGTFNLGTSSELDLVYSTGSSIVITGGVLNIAGGLHGATVTDTTTYDQSNGIVRVATIASSNATFGAFDLRAAGSSFTMSGGSIVHREGTSFVRDHRNQAGTSNVTGGTIQFGDAGSVSPFFSIASPVPIFNLTLAPASPGNLNVRESALTIKGNVTIQAGANMNDIENRGLSVAGNWILNGSFGAFSGTVTFNGSSSQDIGGATTTTFNNLTINNASGVTLSQSCAVNGALTLTAGIVATGSNTLSVGASGSASRTNGYVNGNLKKTYSGPGAFSFLVGTANGYSPVDTTVTSGSGDLTVKAVQGPQPNVNPANSLQRYWTLTGSGITANLVFHYLDPTDIAGNEANYRIIRVTGGSPSAFPNDCGSGSPCVNTAANTATINGIAAFSDWTLGEVQAPTATNGVVSGRLIDEVGNPVAGAVIRLTGTQARKTITDANGEYRFDRVETTGFYTLTPSRANYVFNPANRSFSQIGQSTQASFVGFSPGEVTNPIETPEYYVRQQYLDMLVREPDEAGFNYWSDRILECGVNQACISSRRRDVAAAFFVEREFQDTGYFVYRLYRASFGERPGFLQYQADRGAVIGGADLETARRDLVEAFVQRSAFRSAYPESLSATEFVNRLSDTAGIRSPALRQAQIELLNHGGTRAQVVTNLIDDSEFQTSEYNNAFVATEYFAYLRRDPEPEGFAFWVNVLNVQDPGNYRGLVCSFVTSAEYQGRFAQIVSRSNQECSQ